MAGKQKDIGNLLNSLIELDHDAVAAYEAAIERLENPQYRVQLTEFLADHQRHITELRPLAREFAERVAEGPDMKQVLTKGKVVLASLVGDRAILMAMKTNEDDTNTAYERATANRNAPEHVMTVLQRNLSDERRHRAWIEQTLNTMRREAAGEVRPEVERPSEASSSVYSKSPDTLGDVGRGL